MKLALLVFAGLFILEYGAAAANILTIELSATETDQPFKTIKCEQKNCESDGIISFSNTSIPVHFKISRPDDKSFTFDEIRRGDHIHYLIRPESGNYFQITDSIQRGQIIRDMNRDGQIGLQNDLVFRNNYLLGTVLVQARLDK